MEFTQVPKRLAICALVSALIGPGVAAAEEGNVSAKSLIGYTELQTNLSGGRHANVRTSRAVVITADGSGRKEVAGNLADDPNAWTQFAGWSPDGRTAVIGRGWQDPENAKWEEEHKQFRMGPGKWMYDGYLMDVQTGKLVNVSAVDRVSHYNGISFFPDGSKLHMTSLIDGVSKPFVMDLDGHNKKDVSGGTNGFTYGFSASPGGKRIAYHEGYQVFIADADGSNKKRVETGNKFNFAPSWSPDGRWVLFVSGEHYNCHPHVARADGTGLKKLADRGGYRGVIEFLDVPDFHGGSSDTPVWSVDGKSVFFTAKAGENIELFQVGLDGKREQLTKSAEGTLHYHPAPRPDGKWLLYGSKREGVRQIYLMRLADRKEVPLTHLKPGRAAMWPRWQPSKSP